jgi:hypothetical protein
MSRTATIEKKTLLEEKAVISDLKKEMKDRGNTER